MSKDPRTWSTRRQFLAGTATAGAAALGVDATDGDLDSVSAAEGVVDAIVPDQTLANMDGADYDKPTWLGDAEALESEIEEGFTNVRNDSEFGTHWNNGWGENPYKDTEGALNEQTYQGTGVGFGNVRLSFSDGPFQSNVGPDNGDTAEFWQAPGEDNDTERIGELLTDTYAEGENANEQEVARQIVTNVEDRHDLGLDSNQSTQIANLLNGTSDSQGLFDLGIFIQQTTGENANEQPNYGDLATETVSQLERARDAFGAMETQLAEFSDKSGREISEDARQYVGDLDPSGSANYKHILPLGADHDPATDFKLREARQILENGTYDEDVDNGDGQIKVETGNSSYSGVRGMNQAAIDLNGYTAAATAKATVMHDVLNHVVDQAGGDATHYRAGDFDAQGEAFDHDTATEEPTETPTDTPTSTPEEDAFDYCDFTDSQQDEIEDWMDSVGAESYSEVEKSYDATNGDFTVTLEYEGHTASLDDVEGCGA